MIEKTERDGDLVALKLVKTVVTVASRSRSQSKFVFKSRFKPMFLRSWFPLGGGGRHLRCYFCFPCFPIARMRCFRRSCDRNADLKVGSDDPVIHVEKMRASHRYDSLIHGTRLLSGLT